MPGPRCNRASLADHCTHAVCVLYFTTANVNLTLEVGGVSETVSVIAPVGAVLPDSGTLSKVIDTMALNGRNALYSARWVPGVIGDILNTNNFNTNNFATGGFTNRTSLMTARPRGAPAAALTARAPRLPTRCRRDPRDHQRRKPDVPQQPV